MITNFEHDYYFDSSITPEEFEQQVIFLRKKYNIISIYEALDKARNGDSLKNCLAITFDDGFSECYHIVAPILAEKKMPATFFVIENMIDNFDLMWRNKYVCIEKYLQSRDKKTIINRFIEKTGLKMKGMDLLKNSLKWDIARKDYYANILWREANMQPLNEYLEETKPYMTYKQLKELSINGFDIGSHSRSHPRCDRLSYNELEDELIGSASRISEKLGVSVDLFSYPFGNRPSLNDEIEIIKKGNLRCLLGGRDNLSNYLNPYLWNRNEFQKSFDMAVSFFILGPLRNKFFRPRL
jgi:peptidoglycan/xylan/chitin deacetylase (PgdA/CDA1 family)